MTIESWVAYIYLFFRLQIYVFYKIDRTVYHFVSTTPLLNKPIAVLWTISAALNFLVVSKVGADHRNY